jgi:sporulation protein YlmC with PRC-barrel domain
MSIFRETSGTTPRDETLNLIASDKIEGTAVYNRQGEHLGKVHNFMVDKVSGNVAYAVLSFGGFLGMGESYYPIPWNQLAYDSHQEGYLVNLTRDQLERAPKYATTATPNWTDPSYGRGVDRYYDDLGPRL